MTRLGHFRPLSMNVRMCIDASAPNEHAQSVGSPGAESREHTRVIQERVAARALAAPVTEKDQQSVNQQKDDYSTV
jgi:hypothetical protein